MTAPASWPDLIVVGRIVRPHGIRGQVVVDAETDFGATRFAVGATLTGLMADEIRPFVVSSSRPHGHRWVIGFEGVTTMNEAETLRGVELRVPSDSRPALNAGQYYVHDLADCEVVTMNGTTVGRVARVDLAAGTPLLVVNGPRGEVLVPLAETICRRVDVVAKRIEIDPPGGLIDLNVAGRGGGEGQ